MLSSILCAFISISCRKNAIIIPAIQNKEVIAGIDKFAKTECKDRKSHYFHYFRSIKGNENQSESFET